MIKLTFSELNRVLIRSLVSLFLLVSSCRVLWYRLQEFLPSRIPLKDSAFFFKLYQDYRERGWYFSVAKGTSPIFNLFVRLFELVGMDTFQSMKLVSMLSMIGVILVWYFFAKRILLIPKEFNFLLISILLYIAFYRAAFFSGTNDGLFALWISLGLVFLFGAVKKSSSSYSSYSTVFFVLAFGTRELIVFYFPGLLLIWIIVLVNKILPMKAALISIVIVVVGSLLLYFPALIEHNELRFADKNIDAQDGIWAQKNYVQTYLDIPQMTFEELKQFKVKHPEIHLPTTYSEAIALNPRLTISNAFRQLILITKPFVWQLGILFLVVVIFGFYQVFHSNWSSLYALTLILLISFSICFSVLLINRVEFRWFMIFPFLIVTLGIHLIEISKKEFFWLEYFIWINLILISVLNVFLIRIW